MRRSSQNYRRGKKLDLDGQSVLFKLLTMLAYTQAQGLTKEEIANQVWGYEYDPAIHDSLIYTNIRRLRELIPIQLFDGKYRLPQNIKWALLTQEKRAISKQELSTRQKHIISLLKKHSEGLQRRSLVSKLGISERTALRELTELVGKRILIRNGGGRSVTYRLTGSGD